MKLLLAAVLLACIALGACSAAGYRPPLGADNEPVHGDPGGGSGGGSM